MPASSTLPNLSGSTIDSRYKLLKLLGSGAFGVVYKALDITASEDDPDRFRAVKLVSKSGRKPSRLDAVRREISIQLQVSSHPNVVTLHEAFEDELYFILIMDFCGGGDLGNFIEKHGQFTSETKLRNMFLDIIDAVAALHAEGIYHRDLKPANILLSEDGSQVYIADFGMASHQKTVRSRCGTSSYMSPELLNATKNGQHTRPFSTAACDVWALGVILLNMLTGRMPWKRALPSDVHYAAFVEDPHHLLSFPPISFGLNKLARRMLRANARIRVSLADARRAFANLDVLFRDGKVPLPEYLGLCRESMGSNDIHHLRSTMRSEIDIQDCCAPAEAGVRELDCSAGFAGSTRTVLGTTAPTSSSSSSSGSGPSAASSVIVTPEESTLAVKGVGSAEKKLDAVEDKLKSLVSRLKANLKF